MLTRFHIENFKSLVDFDLPDKGAPLGRFTCLIGLNGSGKSTVLQAIDFVGQLSRGKISEWLAQREWGNSDLTSNVTKRSYVISFRLEFNLPAHPNVVWTGRFNTNQLRCTEESICVADKEILLFKELTLKVADASGEWDQNYPKLDLVFQGSVLSVLQLSSSHPALRQLKEFLSGLKSLELLSPQLIRRKARQGSDIGMGGERLSPFLAKLTTEDQARLNSLIRDFYPQVKNWGIARYRAGWKSLRVIENFSTVTTTNAAHLNDGMLRIFAILAQAYSKHTFLLFDEIENGINAELVNKLVEFLTHLEKQVMVTTHSPMILNYLPDLVARDGVMLLYRDPDGRTHSHRFFDLPRTSDKLRALGPGEVFVDTSLNELVHDLAGSVAGNGTSL